MARSCYGVALLRSEREARGIKRRCPNWRKKAFKIRPQSPSSAKCQERGSSMRRDRVGCRSPATLSAATTNATFAPPIMEIIAAHRLHETRLTAWRDIEISIWNGIGSGRSGNWSAKIFEFQRGALVTISVGAFRKSMPRGPDGDPQAATG